MQKMLVQKKTSYSSESEVDELFIGELKVGTASKMPWLETIMIEKNQSNSNWILVVRQIFYT